MGKPSNLSPSEERIISSTVKLISDYIKANLDDFSGGVCLSGLDTSKLSKAALGLSRKLGKKGIEVYMGKVNGAMEIDLRDYYLQGLARVYAQRFHSKFNDKKRLIVVEGNYSDNMEKFMYHLRIRVGVFVESSEQCPYNEDAFKVPFNNL